MRAHHPRSFDGPSVAVVKVLYVNGTHEGGSLLSTRLLLAEVTRSGVSTELLRAAEPRTAVQALYRRLTNAEVKIGGAVGASFLTSVSTRLGRRITGVDGDWRAQLVENALVTVTSRLVPDVVVVSSVSRVAWLRIRPACTARGMPVVLYLREEALLPHLELADRPDLLLANSRSLCVAAADQGHDATFVPSVIDVTATATESTRQALLVVNPTTHYGLERCLRLARALPGERFVLQESTRLTDAEVGELGAMAADYPNVELRRFTTDVARIYRDARVLLAPYTAWLKSNRPRVVLEAQANGIPVVGSRQEGLVESIGPGGLTVAANASDDEWVEAVASAISEPRYSELCALARQHSRRDEVDPAKIAASFVAAIESVIGR